MIETLSGCAVLTEMAARREGDAPALVASSRKAAAVLHWKPNHDLRSIVGTAWKWHSEENAS
jgi:UDP-glucose 4-epimerase